MRLVSVVFSCKCWIDHLILTHLTLTFDAALLDRTVTDKSIFKKKN